MTIRRGAFAAILGSSGSGKSSLLTLLAGLDRPTSGSLVVFGEDLSQFSRAQLDLYRRKRVGMVFQSFLLVPTLTVYENVELPLMFSEVEPLHRKEVVTSLLRRVGLEKRSGHRPGQLSGGEQQRVAIARALVNQPDMLLADEPTGNLDSQNAQHLMELFAEIHGGGTTVVMVTHEPRLVERYADQTYEMSDGKLASSRASGMPA